jgi:DNA-binding Lrp family transcriptional regulator
MAVNLNLFKIKIDFTRLRNRLKQLKEKGLIEAGF